MTTFESKKFDIYNDIVKQPKGTTDIRVRDLFCVQTNLGFHFGLVVGTDEGGIFSYSADPDKYTPERKLVYFYKGVFNSPDDYVHLERTLENIEYRPSFVFNEMWEEGYFFTVLRPDNQAETFETHIAGSYLYRIDEHGNDDIPAETISHTLRSSTLMWGGIWRILTAAPGQRITHGDQLYRFRENGIFDRCAFEALESLKVSPQYPFNRPGTEPGERRDFEIKKHGHVEQEPDPGDMFVIESTDGFHFGAVLANKIGRMGEGWVLIRLFKGVFDTPDVNQVDTSIENTLFRPVTVNPGFCWWMGHFQPIKHNHHIDLPQNPAYRYSTEIVDRLEKPLPIETPVIADFLPISIQAVGWIIQDQAKWANTHWPYPELNFRYPPDSQV